MTTLFATAGAPRCSVHTTDDAGIVEQFAAGEAVRYLEQIIGSELSSDGELPIHVGLREKLGITDIPASIEGFDGYVLQVRSDRIVIAGDNERGVVYGTYDLLERLGCRWYYPTIDPADPQIIPSLPDAALDDFETAEAAAFEFRVAHPSSMIYNLNVSDARAQVDWAAKARYNTMLFLWTGPAVFESNVAKPTNLPAQDEAAAHQSFPTPAEFRAGIAEYVTTGIADDIHRRGMALEGPNHCFTFLFDNDWFDEHPDWFGMDEHGVRHKQFALGPEFCWSNPAAVEAFCDACVNFLTNNPHLDVFNPIPNDGGKACACPDCRASTPSDLYCSMMNRLMDRLREAKLNVGIEISGGYNPNSEPPESVTLDPDIRVHWAHWGRAHHDFYGSPTYGRRENLDTWIGQPNKFTMVGYYQDAFATPSLFPPAAIQMDNDDRWLIEQGAAGNLSLMFPHGAWYAHTLNAWLPITWFYKNGKTLGRPRTAVEFLDDFASHYFGEAAEPMRTYLRILTEQMWLTYWCCGQRWDAPQHCDVSRIPAATTLLDQLSELLDNAEALASNELDVYRLSRHAAAGRALIALGRARIKSLPVVHRHASEGPTPEVLELIAEIARTEHEELEPMVRGLQRYSGLMPTGFECEKLLRSSAELDKILSANVEAI